MRKTGNVKNLPVWAQDHIRSLERSLERAKADLKVALGESEATFLIRDPEDVATFYGVPGRSVRVDINPEFFVDITMRQEDEGKSITIYGSSAVHLELESSNSFRILQRWRTS